MRVPEGMTESSVMEAIEHVVIILAPSFAFGIYDVEDIRQEARMECLDALNRYDTGGLGEDGLPVRKLENFLYSHVKFRLINLHRNKRHRNDPPCKTCHRALGRVTEHADGRFCPKYLAWKVRNGSKANLAEPVDLGHAAAEQGRQPGPGVEEMAEVAEALALIDEQLDLDLRASYLQMRAGQSVPKPRRLEVERAVLEILGGDYLGS